MTGLRAVFGPTGTPALNHRTPTTQMSVLLHESVFMLQTMHTLCLAFTFIVMFMPCIYYQSDGLIHRTANPILSHRRDINFKVIIAIFNIFTSYTCRKSANSNKVNILKIFKHFVTWYYYMVRPSFWCDYDLAILNTFTLSDINFYVRFTAEFIV